MLISIALIYNVAKFNKIDYFLRQIIVIWLKIDYFNPVVDDWTEECMNEEIRQRQLCDYCLYVITPKMTGVYSIAEVVDDSNKRPDKTIFCLIPSDIGKLPCTMESFTNSQLKSLNQVGVMVEDNGGKYFNNLDAAAEFLNKQLWGIKYV